jgi:O-methyltransferase
MPRFPLNITRLRRQRDQASSDAPSHADELSQLAAEDRRIVEQVFPYSMTGTARLVALIDAVRYCLAREIPGAFAECGVWRGGSVLAMIMTLQELGVSDRDIYLFDTFEGMTEPTEHDVSALDPPALDTWQKAGELEQQPWGQLFSSEVFNEADVRRTVLSTGYPENRIHFVRGPVEETVPGGAPAELALLRLDTDWYESTAHELLHLYPRLHSGGVLIVDDYGHWQGARRAVDEYFSSAAPPLLLNRIDYTGRIAVKH